MTEVVIAGIGQTEVGEHWEISLRDLAYDAIHAAMQDAGGLRPQALFVGNMLAPNLSRQAHVGTLLADYAGLGGIEAVTVEAAGASGGAALRQGYLAIASGMVDVALVVGVEKFTDKVGAEVDEALATIGDSDFEAVQGMTPTSQAALLMKRYMHENDVPADGFAGFALTAHANGAANKHAMFRKAIKPETYAKAEMVSDPINMFDMAPNADGAAALVLTRRDLLPSNSKSQLVKIAGSAASSDTLALHDRKDILYFDTAQLSAGKAMKQAGIVLDQVNFFEYHDMFSIYAALQLEAVGFAIKGKGWKLAADGSIGLKGKIPCATMGGMKARGFPGGASGVYQAIEAVIQLQGQAGANQIKDARYGLIQSLGGPASTAVSHVLQRLD
ncbi:MAG TPA: beta-ketoacyl synthase N-terminal-like domain-containing protein [Anaerolineales bacterium]|nr:beta-ketoacyl synthase N-terminal-like domain-containing protein [Anaerolineales bacterium]HNC89207.1 beta-ketoacyl synthase N-terminal-like domain-containing protein [Anaerolineales bacterium]HNJ14581.1 beta-ketoacyl synthase N-terminal-like domain-containing protein [Anaerolineales bacterium]HNO84977.1 beta-ketoacyl synthase N-terminal-like domain-containing protein [Anaerolineales bacterium]